MTDLVKDVCSVVSETLRTTKSIEALTTPIDANSSMDTVAEWDSLSFVSVFLGVSEHFDIEVDQDDAIAFTSIAGIVELIEDIRDE